MKRAFCFALAVFTLLSLCASVGTAQLRSNKLGIGAGGSTFILMSDNLAKSNFTFGGSFEATYSAMEYLGVRFSMFSGSFDYEAKAAAGGGKYQVSFLGGSLGISADLMPNETINPFVTIGGSFGYYDPLYYGLTTPTVMAGQSRWAPGFYGGAGVDLFLNEFWSITASGTYTMAFSKYVDGIGGSNKGYITASIGVKYYFFDETFMKRMINALRDRYEQSEK